MTAAGAAPRHRAEQLASTLPPLLVAAERVAAVVSQGVHGRRRVGIGETFWQFRRYQPGEETTRIDWRQTAKRAHVFIRENEWEAAQTVLLWADRSASMDFRSPLAAASKGARANLLTLALAVLLTRGGEYVGLLGTGGRPATGNAAVTRLAEALSRDPGEAESLPPATALPRHAQIVWFGDLLAPIETIEGVVKHFVGAGARGHLVAVVDPAEETLPYAGRTRFVGLEGEGEILIGRPDAVRPGYTRRFDAHYRAIAELARAAGWTMLMHHTDRPAQEALMALYAALSQAV